MIRFPTLRAPLSFSASRVRRIEHFLSTVWSRASLLSRWAQSAFGLHGLQRGFYSPNGYSNPSEMKRRSKIITILEMYGFIFFNSFTPPTL